MTFFQSEITKIKIERDWFYSNFTMLHFETKNRNYGDAKIGIGQKKNFPGTRRESDDNFFVYSSLGFITKVDIFSNIVV